VMLVPRIDAQKTKDLALQLGVYAFVGTMLTLVYGLMYLPLREFFDAQTANAIALIGSTIVGTWGHRRVTFRVRGRARTVSHQVLGLVLLGFGLATTAASLWLLEQSVETPTRVAELTVLALANLGVGLVRFAAFRMAMVPEPSAD
jgi:putative flippase GtrA